MGVGIIGEDWGRNFRHDNDSSFYLITKTGKTINANQIYIYVSGDT